MATLSSRERVVEAARELFWLKGYGSTSVADILAKAEVNSGSLYHHFPGKQDVLLAVLETYRDGIYPMLIDPVWEGVLDPVERIFALLGKYRDLIQLTGCSYGCPIGSLALELHEPDPAVRELIADNFSAWTGAIGQCLDAAADRLRDDVDRPALAEFVLTVMEGAVMQARTYRDIVHFDRAVSQLRRYLDALLAGPLPTDRNLD